MLAVLKDVLKKKNGVFKVFKVGFVNSTLLILGQTFVVQKRSEMVRWVILDLFIFTGTYDYSIKYWYVKNQS